VRQQIAVAHAFGWELPLAPRRPASATRPPASAPRRPASAPRAEPVRAEPVEGPVEGPVTDLSAERAARESLLAPLRVEVRDCERCELCRLGRTRTVFGVGDACARVMFVGEGPGQEEDRRGEPFVGPAGRLLTDIIEKGMGLRREDVYIANVVKCRPPGNRTPSDAEMAACSPYLERQIEIVRPHAIVALGSVASRGLLRSTESVGRLRGRFHDYRGTPLRVTYHPAYLLRSPHEKRKTWEDIQAVMAYLGLPPRGGR
jgi:DNA polymerase